MHKVPSTLGRIATLIMVIILAIAAFWLVGRQAQPGSQPTAQDTDRPTPPPATPQPTIPPTPLPTATSTAPPTATTSPSPTHTPFTPGVSFGKGSLVTLPPPEPSATPLGRGPDAAVSLVSDTPLLPAEVLSLIQIPERITVRVEDWPVADELIVSTGQYPGKTYWFVSIDKAQARQIAAPQANPLSNAAIAELRQFDERVDYASVSPDGQWAAWGQGETLLIKRLGTNKPPINLLGVREYERFERGSGRLTWSPLSDKVAYVIGGGSLHHRYEIRISDPVSRQTQVISLSDTNPSDIAWSPDGRYLAFIMLEEPQSGIEKLYGVRLDGSGLTQLTQHGNVNGPIHWSPAGEAIVYTHSLHRHPWVTHLIRQ